MGKKIGMQKHAGKVIKCSFLSRYGYGSRVLEPAGASLCTLGSGDFLASDDGAESFMALYLKAKSLFINLAVWYL